MAPDSTKDCDATLEWPTRSPPAGEEGQEDS